MPKRLGVMRGLIGFAVGAILCLVPVGATEVKRDRYQIELQLDQARAVFNARQILRWTNRTETGVGTLEFNLYPNVGLNLEAEGGDPSLRIFEVVIPGRQVRWSLRARQTQMRLEIEPRVEAGQRVAIQIGFAGRIPRLQREETSLLAHFMQEVNDALDEVREPVDARDIFFAGEEGILLGYFYPILATRPAALHEIRFPIGINSLVQAELADYEVGLTLSAAGAQVVSSGRPVRGSVVEGRRPVHRFVGEARRGFALVIGERLRAVEKVLGRTTVVSWYHEGDQRAGERVLDQLVAALGIYREAFGEYPYEYLQAVEFPVAAGYSAIDLPGLVVLPQAYYIDFGSVAASRLPGVIREQEDVIRASFELNVVQSVAHQWWGRVVGADAERSPAVSEALALFAAVYYHEKRYGPALAESIVRRYVRGAYQAYRMLDGVDEEAERPLKEYDSVLQYAAIIQAKGALLLLALRRELGDEQTLAILRDFYREYAGEQVTAEQFQRFFQLRSGESKVVRALFQRWWREKRGDEDIGAPEPAQVPAPVSRIRALGRVFLRIGKRAARPF
jgi:hypothetical protein